jgi:branched-chain amino acid transport system permease protein
MNSFTASTSVRKLRGAIDAIARHRVAATVAFLVVFPWLVPYHALAVNILIWGLFALGFNLLYGYAGLLSFGHAAFLGVGSYGCGIAVVHLGLPWYLAIPFGVASAALAALVIGFLAIRTRGIYFAMVTLALSQCVYYIFYKWESVTGGENGLRGINVAQINLFGFEVDFLNPVNKYYAMLAVVVLALWVFSRILASPFGAVLETIRENEKRAAACGYNVAQTKLVAFVLSGAFCGLAGALRALHLSTVPVEVLQIQTSGDVVVMALLGGFGTFFGPFVGAVVFQLFEDVMTVWTTHWQLYLGATFIVFVLFFPRGIWGSILHWLRVKA